MKISASIYAQSDKDLATLVADLDQLHVDYFHVDCNDDITVFQDLKELNKLSSTPADLHLITKTPSAYFELIAETKPARLCFQFEDLPKAFNFPKIEGVKWGLAIRTETPISVFDTYANSCDYILIMATTPGKSGGKFNPENFKKIRDFHRQFPDKEVEVDGGVNHEVSFILRNYGVQVAVVGSYLMKHEVQSQALSLLKHEHVESHYKVSDMMILKDHLPVLLPSASVIEILQTNEKYSHGYVLFENDLGEFKGISTNADLRRALLKHPDNFNQLSAKDLINSNPISINEDCTVEELFQLLRSNKQTISYLPVVNNTGQLRGAINFNALIKGEL